MESGMKRYSVLLVVLCFSSACPASPAMPPQTHPTTAWRAAQEEQIRTIVFLRLYREYCGRGRRAPGLLFLNVSDRGGPDSLQDPDRSTLAYLPARLPAPVKGASAL